MATLPNSAEDFLSVIEPKKDTPLPFAPVEE
jgi:hypothetical protein